MVNWREVFGRSASEPPLEPGAFRRFALRTLKERFHDASFTEADDSLSIAFGEHRFGLQSARAICERDHLNADELRELLVTHFERMLAASAWSDGPAPPLWKHAEARLRPQIMPIEYVGQAPVPLLTWPLNNDVSIGIVIDEDNSYSYVRGEDPYLWGQSPDQVRDRAVANLDERSAGIEMHSTDGPERFIGIQVADGYDAARILLPNLRRYLEEQFGTPFFAGIPNRDFLICWSRSCSEEFNQFARQKVAEDCGVQPYPLTPCIFIASADSLEPETNSA